MKKIIHIVIYQGTYKAFDQWSEANAFAKNLEFDDIHNVLMSVTEAYINRLVG